MQFHINFEKDDLDFQIVSLIQLKQEYSDLLHYSHEYQDAITELRNDIEKRIVKVMELYALL